MPTEVHFGRKSAVPPFFDTVRTSLPLSVLSVGNDGDFTMFKMYGRFGHAEDVDPGIEVAKATVPTTNRVPTRTRRSLIKLKW
jgi:hypothetical protein